MGVCEDGQVCGSVSGGCVEGSTIQSALESLADGKPRELSFGSISDAEIWEVGLSCGGKISVLVEPEPYLHFPGEWTTFTQAIREDRPTSLSTQLEPWQKAIDGAEGFVHHVAPRDRLVIIGASHIAIPLIALAKTLGFAVTVLDPRSALTHEERLGAVDRLIVGWPQAELCRELDRQNVYAVTLSHDPKIDDVALRMLMRSGARYVGALGSRSTQEARNRRFASEGFTSDEIGRIHGPVGLKIGAKSPEEIALSIMAEIVKVRSGA